MNPIFEYSDTLNNPYEAFFLTLKKTTSRFLRTGIILWKFCIF